MSKKAVLVGLNYPGTSAALHGCIHDIERMRAVLISKYGYSPDNIVMLRDDVANPSTQPTRANILAHLRTLVAPGPSEIWFHYSGHGSQIRDADGDEADGQDEVLVPSDYQTNGVISDDEVHAIIQTASSKVVLIIDACHSGSMCDLEYGWSIDVPHRRFRRFRNSSRKTKNPNIVAISGCQDRQTSADTFNSELNIGVGAFTDALLYTLHHHQYKGSLLFIYQETCRLLHARRYEQMPVLSSSGPSIPYMFKPAVMQFA